LQNAQEKIEAGAELLQVYSGLIYHGPALIKQLVEGIK
jgi:dihydroorotate oxidase